MLRQFYLLRGSPARVLPLFAWVGIDMVLWGFITRYLNTVASAGLNFVPVLLGAVLLSLLFWFASQYWIPKANEIRTDFQGHT